MIRSALNEVGCEELPSGCDDLSVEHLIENKKSVSQDLSVSDNVRSKRDSVCVCVQAEPERSWYFVCENDTFSSRSHHSSYVLFHHKCIILKW